MRPRFGKLRQLFFTPNENRLLPNRRPLRVEPLEGRWLLSVGTLLVDADSPAGTPDGQAWETAYPDLQEALDQAATLNTDAIPENNITQIWIAEGTYRPTALLSEGVPYTATFLMLDGVSLYGGFYGDEPNLDSRHGAAAILSGDLDGDGDGDAVHVVYYYGLTNVTLDTLTITGGKGADTVGGGIYNYGTLTVTNVTISGNSATYGGGIYNSGILTIAASTISGNVGGNGAGIYNRGTLTVEESTISNNSSWDEGGGIRNMTLDATLTVIGSIISGNAARWGGGIANKLATATVTGSIISGNSAVEEAGGIHNSQSNRLTVINSTISGNAARYGGGIYSPYAKLTFRNTILAGNTASVESDDVRAIVVQSSSHNLIGDGNQLGSQVTHGENGNLIGTTESPIDPRFVRAPSDGGDGWGDDPDTADIDEGANDDFGDLRLLPDSPAIDAGDDAWAVDAEGNPLVVDLDGNPRIIGQHVDMGAYEAPITVYWDGNGDGDWSDLRWLDAGGTLRR